jgi:glycosyltransferase 2 family protein
VVPRLKAILKYLAILAITAFLIWLSLRGITVNEDENKWQYIYNTWLTAHKGWLLAMAGFAVISHLIRAERWRMLLEPTDHQTTLKASFLSLMVGYLVNLAIPRGGEVSRCYNLYKLDKTPIEVSFGTVVVERILDVLCLAVLIIISFLVESEKLFSFIESLPFQLSGVSGKVYALLIVLGSGTLALVLLYWFTRKNQKLKARLMKLVLGFKQGLVAVFKQEKKARFIFYTITIWLLYFVMSYCVILAFDATSHLGFGAVLSLFAIGSIAMAAPLPGGMGSYHALVPAGIVFLYQIPHSQAVAFTFIFHGWQTLIFIVGGSISVIATSILSSANKAPSKA